MCDTVITGTGVISAAGIGASRILRAMASNAYLFSGGPADNEDAQQFPWPIAKVNPADAPWPQHDAWWIDNQKFANLAAHWAVAAASAALKTAQNADEHDAERCGVIMALASGEEESVKAIPKLAALAQTDPRPLATILYEEVPDYSYVRGIPSQTGQFIAKISGFRGSNVAVYGEASAGGLAAMALGVRLLQSGELDRVIVVGVSPPCSPAALALLDRFDALGTEAAGGRGPFDLERRGLLLGQGSAAIALERKESAQKRGLEPLAELVCCETICAATLPQAISAAVELILPEADGTPDVWWAHGCGSVSADAVECQAVGALIRPTTTSTKGTIGNAVECGGLIDVAVAVEALNHEVIPPVGLLRRPDPALGDFDFVKDAPRQVPLMRSALITALGHPSNGATSAGAVLMTRHGGQR